MSGRGSRASGSCWIESYVTRSGKRRWRVRWADPRTGQVKSQSTGPDKAVARRIRNERLRQIRPGGSGDGGHHAGELAEKVDLWMAGLAQLSRVVYRQVAERFVADMGPVRLAWLDRAVVMEWRATLLAAESTVNANKMLRHMRSLLSYATDAGWVTANPMLGWKKLLATEPEVRVRVVEIEEFEALLGACGSPMLQALVTVAYYEGLRRRELAHLRWAEVDIQGRTLQVVNYVSTGELTKTRRVRAVPLREPAAEALQWWQGQAPQSEYVFCWPTGEPLKYDWISRWFRAVVDGLGADYTLHDLRRSFSTLLQRRGVDAEIVRALGGWSSLDVVRRHYTGDVSEGHRQAVRVADAG